MNQIMNWNLLMVSYFKLVYFSVLLWSKLKLVAIHLLRRHIKVCNLKLTNITSIFNIKHTLNLLKQTYTDMNICLSKLWHDNPKTYYFYPNELLILITVKVKFSNKRIIQKIISFLLRNQIKGLGKKSGKEGEFFSHFALMLKHK